MAEKSKCVPIKSRSDYREYRVVDLDNGVKVLLVSDIKPPSVNCYGEEEEEGGFEIVEDEVRRRLRGGRL